MPDTPETTAPQQEIIMLHQNTKLFTDLRDRRCGTIRKLDLKIDEDQLDLMGTAIMSGMQGAIDVIEQTETATAWTTAVGTQAQETKKSLALIAITLHHRVRDQEARANDLSAQLNRYRRALLWIKTTMRDTPESAESAKISEIISTCVSEGDETHLS